MKVEGNKVLITGATSGIGEALLRKFLSLGSRVIAVGRNERKLMEMAFENRDIIPFACDISDQEDLDRLTVFVEHHHRDTNVLVNNAGVQYNYQFEDENQLLGRIEQEINVNFIAPIKLISLLLPTLRLNPNAAIVNVSSGLALVPKKQAPVYCGTKAGIHIFSQSLRHQLSDVKVFEIIPPLVDTRMTEGRGKGKMRPEQVADEFIRAFRKDRYEINVGKVKLLKLINRLSPKLAESIMKNGGEK